MPKVEIYAIDGGWAVGVFVGTSKTAEFGPMERNEADAFVRGAKAFAIPFTVNFNEN